MPPEAPPPAPAPNTRLSGRLRPDATEWGTLLLDEVALDDAISAALKIDLTAAAIQVEISVRVVDPEQSTE